MALDFLFYNRLVLEGWWELRTRRVFLINHFVENLINVKMLERLSREFIYTRPWINQCYMLSKTWHNLFLTPVKAQSPISFGASDFIIFLNCCRQENDPSKICCCSLVSKLCLTLCNPRDCSMPSLPEPHHLPEFAQVHVSWVGDAIQTISATDP